MSVSVGIVVNGDNFNYDEIVTTTCLVHFCYKRRSILYTMCHPFVSLYNLPIRLVAVPRILFFFLIFISISHFFYFFFFFLFICFESRAQMRGGWRGRGWESSESGVTRLLPFIHIPHWTSKKEIKKNSERRGRQYWKVNLCISVLSISVQMYGLYKYMLWVIVPKKQTHSIHTYTM